MKPVSPDSIRGRFRNGHFVDIDDLPVRMFRWCSKERVKKEKTIKQATECFERNLIIYHIKEGAGIKELCEELEKSERQVKRIIEKYNIKFKARKGRPGKKYDKNGIIKGEKQDKNV